MKRLRTVALAALCVLAQGAATAGRTCEQQLPLAANVQRSMDLAQRTAYRVVDSLHDACDLIAHLLTEHP